MGFVTMARPQPGQNARLNHRGFSPCCFRIHQNLVHHTLNDVPHPHDFVEFGLMKLNPCRISVSS
jgi:hypothetical protein